MSGLIWANIVGRRSVSQDHNRSFAEGTQCLAPRSKPDINSTAARCLNRLESRHNGSTTFNMLSRYLCSYILACKVSDANQHITVSKWNLQIDFIQSTFSVRKESSDVSAFLLFDSWPHSMARSVKYDDSLTTSSMASRAALDSFSHSNGEYCSERHSYALIVWLQTRNPTGILSM